MTDPTVERAIAILEGAPSVALPLPELARRLGTVDADALALRMTGDPRLRLLPAPGLRLVACPDPRRAATYGRALRAAGLLPDRQVALVDAPAPPPDAGALALLRATTALLLGPGQADDLLAAAGRAGQALRATLPEAP